MTSPIVFRALVCSGCHTRAPHCASALQSHSHYYTCASSVTNNHKTKITQTRICARIEAAKMFRSDRWKIMMVLFHHRGLHKNAQEYLRGVPHYNKRHMQTIPFERHALLELARPDTSESQVEIELNKLTPLNRSEINAL